MDALPNIGHACGHNLIAVSGIAMALAIKAVLDKFNIDGTIVLLGTPGMCNLELDYLSICTASYD